MTSITPKHTKAQILDAYAEAQARLAAGPTWPQVASKVADTSQTVAREAVALVKDCYNAGALLRQWVSAIVAELSRPVIRSKA